MSNHSTDSLLLGEVYFEVAGCCVSIRRAYLFCFLLLGVEGVVVIERFLFMLFFFNCAVNYNTAVIQIVQHC